MRERCFNGHDVLCISWRTGDRERSEHEYQNECRQHTNSPTHPNCDHIGLFHVISIYVKTAILLGLEAVFIISQEIRFHTSSPDETAVFLEKLNHDDVFISMVLCVKALRENAFRKTFFIVVRLDGTTLLIIEFWDPSTPLPKALTLCFYASVYFLLFQYDCSHRPWIPSLRAQHRTRKVIREAET
jgi:hypothetical protein